MKANTTEQKALALFTNLLHWSRTIDSAPDAELAAKRIVANKLCDYVHGLPGKHNRARYQAVGAIRKLIIAHISIRAL